MDEPKRIMGDERKRIWWLASYPKSGSTWVRMLLNAYITGFPPEINSAWQYASGDLQPHVYQLTAAQPIDKFEDVDSVYYRPAVPMNFVLTSPTTDRVLKTHHAKVELDGIPLIPPRLSRGGLYVVRDPRSIAPSFADHMGISIDEAVDLMANNQATIHKESARLYHVLLSWSSHVDSWTVANKDLRVGVVRYEDLVEHPDETWPAVLRALGLDVDRDRLRVAIDRASFDRMRAAEDEKGFREKGKGARFFRRGRVDAWRDELSAAQVKRIARAHRATMERFGYLTAKPRRSGTLGRLKTAAAGTVA